MANMWAAPGVKCMCVQDDWSTPNSSLLDPKYRPTFMAQYTIRDVSDSGTLKLGVGLHLEEMPLAPNGNPVWYSIIDPETGKPNFMPLEPLPTEEQTREVELT